MLMFTNIYPIGPRNECFSMFMIDARAAVPKLVKALGDYAEYLPPIEIAKPVRLHREHPQKVEKNWAPFQAPVGPASGDIYFSVDLDGQRVYKYNEDEDFVVPLSSPESDQEAEEEQPPQKTTCMHKVTDKYHYWQVHQGTPILSMTLCNRGECEPNIHNTVNFGIIQPKYIKPLNWYEPRVVTWNITQPFEWRSISKRLTYHGTKTREYIYTMHMGYYFNRAAPPVNKAHGYLDDEIWLGFGIADSKGAFIDVDARELMRDHYYCENATLDYRIES